jgi:hypothetical protein
VGIEEQIASRLQLGAEPRELVAEGFRKSTVYKVAETMRAHHAPTPAPMVLVNLTTDRERYLPGEIAQLRFALTNQSSTDLYVFQAGVRPEWLEPGQWVPSLQRKLLSPGDTLPVRLSLPLPPALPLGEKELLFGVQGQWVGPDSRSPSNEIMWTSPLLLRLQRNWTGATVFLAHSVRDISLVSKLESTLDDNGIRTVVADTSSTLQSQVAQANFVVAVLTDSGSRLAFAAEEIVQAIAQGKTLILLRDRSLAALTPLTVADLPWIDVDFSQGAASIVTRLFAELNELNTKRIQKKEQDDALGVILLALGALAAGIALTKGGSGGGGIK